MKLLNGKTIVVAGGTGNVGSFIVRGLLNAGARVAVTSRSDSKLGSFRKYLEQFEELSQENLYTFNGNISDTDDSKRLLNDIKERVGTPNGTISTLGGFIPAPSLLTVDLNDLDSVMNNYLISHFVVARTFLPVYKTNGGTFVFVNGPLALNPWDGSGLVSIATAGQQMLFRSLAKELEDSPARVTELMTYAFIRNRKTQPQSNVSGEAVGALASWMVSDSADDIHGESVHLKSMEKLKEMNIELS